MSLKHLTKCQNIYTYIYSIAVACIKGILREQFLDISMASDFKFLRFLFNNLPIFTQFEYPALFSGAA